MRDYYHDENHTPFGWLKTLGLVVVLFALMISTGLMAAKAADNPCAQSCQTKHNECRIRTKGAPACDAQLDACRQSCISAIAKQPLLAAPKK